MFGCQGSSNVVMQGLDRALDPNEDGDFSDRANIINLSLGSEFSPADDPDSAMVDALAQQGILTVTAAGNANEFNGVGDTYSDSGSPANAASSISVANANGTMSVSDQLKIVSPENGIPLILLTAPLGTLSLLMVTIRSISPSIRHLPISSPAM